MITDLRLQNFRSYSDMSFEVSPGVNIIVGPNASGKTNLLEAVLFIARGKSYRAKDNELIKFNKPWARLDANTQNEGLRTTKLFSDKFPAKEYEINGKNYKRLPPTQSLPAVLFEPNHLLLLSSGPEKRRDYMDDILEQTVPGYGVLRRNYKRALAQRNNLLKRPEKISTAVVFPWNVRLSQLAGQIVRHRTELVTRINKDFGPIYKKLSKTKTQVGAAYQNQWPPDQYETKLLKELESKLNDDLTRGFTSIGPHREDLLITFNSRPAQDTASRGEIRTAILALKIIELKILEEHSGKTPILLLDDVFSELDGKRRHALTEYLKSYQTFITTTDADLVVKNFTQKCNIIALT